MKFKMPELPYAVDALEPSLSAETVTTHYEKHHRKYLDNINKLIVGTAYEDMSLEEIITESFQREVDEGIFNNAAQFWNHNFYWMSLTPTRKSKLSTALTKELEDGFGSIRAFADEFKTQVKKLFGSGYVWLVKDEDGALEILSLKDAECPLVHHKIPLLCCDVWEHAYYLDVKNERERYFENYWSIVNWKFVEKNNKENLYNPEGRVILHEDFMGISRGVNLGFS
ncbi:MAG: superoxide dismutase [Bdellovibrionales bacterium]|nr:superoxide dismutase [Bdellovibrionales bacterium]